MAYKFEPPTPKMPTSPETMALAVQIDPALGEMMMDVPAIRIAHLGQDVGIIVPESLAKPWWRSLVHASASYPP